MTPHFTVEMYGPEAAITVRLKRPSTFEGSFADAARSFTMTIHRPAGAAALVIGPTSWAWGSLTAAGGNAVYFPIETDFPAEGRTIVDMVLELDGTEYPLVSQRIEIKPKTG